MPRYLVLWEVDQTKIPPSPKDRGTGWAALMKLVRQDFEKGFNKDWGTFVGENKGFSIMEGSELEIMKSLQQFVPFIRFQLHTVASESQVNEVIKGLLIRANNI